MRYLAFILAGYLILSCHRQESLQPTNYQAIDELLEQYQGNRPGYALGIVQKGQVTYTKGYGLANLDYKIPISDSSAFYIGSMAKQFTAAALLILEAEHKIDLDASVNDYLPSFPEYKDEITINHLIHHTSGIRETNSLQLFQGIDRKFEEVFDTDDLLQLVTAQKELNFRPGQEYRYSSGGYAVLAKIVEKITGQSFRAFAKTKIFGPLGMNSTLVCDDHNEVIPNRAVSYWPSAEGGYERRSQVFDAYGDGGIITTVQDLAKWDRAFYSDLLGVEDFSEKMYQKSKLNNGDTIDYARALNVWEYKGQTVVQHNGGMLGFRVDMVRFPALETTIILLGNSAYLNPTGLALEMADLLLGQQLLEKKRSKTKPAETDLLLTSQQLAKWTGYYWTDQTNYFRRITRQKDSLFLDSGNANYRQYLMPLSKNEFHLADSDPAVHLAFDLDGKDLVMQLGNTIRDFRKFDPTPPQKLQELMRYVGHYKSAELQSTYHIFQEKNRLYLRINQNAASQIFPLPENSELVWNGKEMLWIGFGEIKFALDGNGFVQGLFMGDSRVSGVWFEKQR